ncbi:MAG TPA: hypothetical protein VFQ53_30170 [Kofleriaceae bacterium]|nr:hypothetical protein [Kofleriaceae bacterium]
MAKRDQDSTMELSMRDLVVPKPPPHGRMGPPANMPTNDRSVWGQLVVGADDFAPAARRPAAPAKSRRGVLIVTIAGLALGTGVGAAYLVTRDGDAAAKTAASAPAPAATPPAKPDPAPTGSAAIASPAEPSKAAPTVAQDPAAGSGSAAVPATIAATTAVDAVSGVAPVIKAKKATATKRPAKKTAAATSKKRVTKKRR